jgi:chemotaxis signal transduction protein
MDLTFRKSKRYMLGLDCLIADERLVIPSAAVQQIIDYEVAPFPSSRPEIAGVGVYMGEVIISLRIGGWGPPPPGRRSAKGVLLAPAGPSPGPGHRRVAWVVEVSEIVAFVDAAPDEEAPPSTKSPTHFWSRVAVTRNGATVPWLDVDVLLDAMVPALDDTGI